MKIHARMRKKDRESQLTNIAKEDISTKDITSNQTSRKNLFYNSAIQMRSIRER